MSAIAIPVDWVYNRAREAVKSAEPVDIQRLMDDCDLDRDEAVMLLNAAAYEVYGQAYVDAVAEDLVLH